MSEVKTIEQELEKLQEQIEQTTDPQTRCTLFLKKIDLLKLQKPKIDYKKIIDQLEYDIKKEMIK